MPHFKAFIPHPHVACTCCVWHVKCPRRLTALFRGRMESKMASDYKNESDAKRIRQQGRAGQQGDTSLARVTWLLNHYMVQGFLRFCRVIYQSFSAFWIILSSWYCSKCSCSIHHLLICWILCCWTDLKFNCIVQLTMFGMYLFGWPGTGKYSIPKCKYHVPNPAFAYPPSSMSS